MHKCESTILTDSFTNFGGIVSGPEAFLIFMFFYVLMFFICLTNQSVLDFFLIREYFDVFHIFKMILRTAFKLSSQFLKLFSTGLPEVFSTISMSWLLKI